MTTLLRVFVGCRDKIAGRPQHSMLGFQPDTFWQVSHKRPWVTTCLRDGSYPSSSTTSIPKAEEQLSHVLKSGAVLALTWTCAGPSAGPLPSLPVFAEDRPPPPPPLPPPPHANGQAWSKFLSDTSMHMMSTLVPCCCRVHGQQAV